MSAKPPKAEDGSEDAVSWDRFERAVDSALHTPPQHKPKTKTKKGAGKPAPLKVSAPKKG